MTEHGHKTLQTFLWCSAVIVVAVIAFKLVKERKPDTIIENRRDSAQVIIINPTPSQTIIGKEPTYIPTNYDSLVKMFIQAVKERDEVNKYDSTVYVKHDTDTVANIPYHITTKGKLLDFKMTPVVISTSKTIYKEEVFGLYGGLSSMVVGKDAYINVEGSYQGKNGQIYTLGKGLNTNSWMFGVQFPLVRKWK